MANEITYSATITVRKGELSKTLNFSDVSSLSASPVYCAGGVQNVGTTEEAVAVGDVASAGFAYFKNVDATNYVQLGAMNGGTFVPFVKLTAGQACVLPLGTSAPYAKANTAAVALDYFIFSA